MSWNSFALNSIGVEDHHPNPTMASVLNHTPARQLWDWVSGQNGVPPSSGAIAPESDAKVADIEKVAVSSQTSSQSGEANDLVDWDGPEDPENPQNWSTAKKSFVFFQICLLTFASMSQT